jgi:hypothetical protein
MGLEQNEEEALKLFTRAVAGGDLPARHFLACAKGRNGDRAVAMRHWRSSASGGLRVSMEALIAGFEERLLHHADLAETLQAFYLARAELWSVGRERYIAHLKMIGKYKEEFDM